MTSMVWMCLRLCRAGQVRIQAFTLGNRIYAFPQGPRLSDRGANCWPRSCWYVGPGPWISICQQREWDRGVSSSSAFSETKSRHVFWLFQVIHRDLKPENVLIVRTGSPADMRWRFVQPTWWVFPTNLITEYYWRLLEIINEDILNSHQFTEKNNCQFYCK